MLFTHEISDNLINDHDIGMKYKAFPNEDVKTKKKMIMIALPFCGILPKTAILFAGNLL